MSCWFGGACYLGRVSVAYDARDGLFRLGGLEDHPTNAVIQNCKYPFEERTQSTPAIPRAALVSIPGVTGTRPKRLLWQLLYILLLQSCILPVTGVRVGSEPTALPGAQNGGLDNEVTFCAKPSGNPNFSGPYLGAVRKRAYKRACDRAAIRGGTYYRGTWHTARALQALRVQPGQNRRELQRREPARGRSASRVHVSVVECRWIESCNV